MFTGIIEDIGTVKNISGSKIIIETKLDDIKIGDSISVNGVCLTVTHFDGSFSADYSPQTDRLTNLSLLKSGSRVNLERALTLSSRLGGHIVLGHIDGTGKIENIEKQDKFFKISFSCDDNLSKYCVDKGSIAIDGISLTLSCVSKNAFEIFIIPQSFNNTALQYKKENSIVNIETDIISKYLEKIEQNKKSGADLFNALKESGFL
ncbi:MAG: riboflavin synthase [Elusimicrobiota bacterium]|jgi:riboflavin synthase|nr:riboflavin synthase [Elusimicrobiota bacterium]